MKINLETLFGDEALDVECPQCHSHFKIKFREVMKDGNVVQCPQCQVNIQLNHDETTKKTLTDTDKAIKEFNRTMDKLEKTLKKFGK